jgi:nitrite reductase (NO-forming)
MKQLAIRSVSAVATLAIVGLALVPLAGAHADRQTRSTATTVQVQGGEFFFKLSTKSVASPRKVTFVFKNVGHVLHDFSINGKKTPLTSPGKKATLIVTFKKKGKFTYICTVPGHAAAGMKGVFTVR